jgi:23S rRNA pseudouridine1911/1915/1917 synthase
MALSIFRGTIPAMIEPELVGENEFLVAINKPAGLIVHSDGRTIEPTLVDWFVAQWPQIAGVGEPWLSPQGASVPRPGIVHRLDRTTSGIMIVAKTQEAWEYLRNEFKERRVEKTYHALVYGHMETDEGRIVAEIDKGGTPRKWYAKDTDENDVRAAITDWRVLKKSEIAGEAVSLLEAKPRTGRTHQLRVHFAHIGHPIVADHLYAAEMPALGAARPMLHAYSIALILPSGESVSYAAPSPEDFIL